MSQSLSALTLVVRDYDEAVGFFVGMLGFDLLEAPREEPYGIVVVFEDLYGNRWDLIQSRAAGQRPA